MDLLKLEGKTMTNVAIEKVKNHVVDFYCVIADTKRFGKGAVMYQGTLEGCKKYIKDRGIKLSDCENYNSFSHNKIRDWYRCNAKR